MTKSNSGVDTDSDGENIDEQHEKGHVNYLRDELKKEEELIKRKKKMEEERKKMSHVKAKEIKKKKKFGSTDYDL